MADKAAKAAEEGRKRLEAALQVAERTEGRASFGLIHWVSWIAGLLGVAGVLAISVGFWMRFRQRT